VFGVSQALVVPIPLLIRTTAEVLAHDRSAASGPGALGNGNPETSRQAKSDAEERRILREYQDDNTGQRVQISVGPPVWKRDMVIGSATAWIIEEYPAGTRHEIRRPK
jgi:hypothetical protein